MKIIELLNRIANGEEVPKRILLYEDEIWEYNEDYNCYQRPYGSYSNLWDNKSFDILNEEVEIIKEEKKIPEKIDVWYEPIKDTKLERHDTDTSIEILAIMCDDLKDKYNEIIDYLKENNGRD